MEPKNSVSEQLLADLVITNGKVVTVDNNFSIAQAVAVKSGKIMAVGTNDEIKTLTGKKTRVLDLKGKAVLPGICDAHIHANWWGSMIPPIALDIDYPAVKSISDIARVVGEKAKTVEPGEWIRGMGLNLRSLAEHKQDSARYPTRWDLDPVSPDNPVYLGVTRALEGGAVLINTKALELTGITKDTPVPPGGEIVKDPATGEPTGLLRGRSGEDMVTKIVPPFTKEQKRQAILAAMRELNKLGITSITEPGLGPSRGPFGGGLGDAECISIYNDLYNEGNLTVRVGILLSFHSRMEYDRKKLREGLSFFGIHTGFGNEWLRIAGLKLGADNIPPQKTAWMYEDYVDGGNFKIYYPGETDEERCQELMNAVTYAHKLGFQVGIHVSGDRAVDACIDSFVEAEREEPKGLRHYIIHGDFIMPERAKRMAEYNICVSVQPALEVVAGNLMKKVVGNERMKRLMPLRSLIDAGVHVAGGSDAPVIFPDWKEGIQSAILRELPDGEVFGPEQRITIKEAIRIYTIEGAWQEHMEHIRGSIEAGKVADFCILDEDILSVEPHKIKDIRTLITIVGGKIVYDAGI